MAKKKKSENHLVRNVIAGTAVVGAGLLTAKVLSDKDTRENIVAEFEELKMKIEKSKEARDLQEEINNINKVLKEIRESSEEDAGKLVDQVKASVEKLRKDFEELQNK